MVLNGEIAHVSAGAAHDITDSTRGWGNIGVVADTWDAAQYVAGAAHDYGDITTAHVETASYAHGDIARNLLIDFMTPIMMYVKLLVMMVTLSMLVALLTCATLLAAGGAATHGDNSCHYLCDTGNACDDAEHDCDDSVDDMDDTAHD